MARGVPRTGFNSPRLIRVLADLGVASLSGAKQSLGERLSHWLDFNDAMALFGALTGVAGPQTAPSAADETTLRADFARVQDSLVAGIRVDGVFHPGKARIKLPIPAPQASAESPADFSPYHRYYLAHQREMTSAIGPLRVHARATLARRAATGQRLAALDAVLEEALAPRERTLLATIPLLLAKHFEHMYATHSQGLTDIAEDDPERWLAPGGWLAAFCCDLQGVLLAEVEFRLLPVAGLIEALGSEGIQQQ